MARVGKHHPVRLHRRGNNHHGASTARRLAELTAPVISSCYRSCCLIIANVRRYCFFSPFFPTAWTVPLLEVSSGVLGHWCSDGAGSPAIRGSVLQCQCLGSQKVAWEGRAPSRLFTPHQRGRVPAPRMQQKGEVAPPPPDIGDELPPPSRAQSAEAGLHLWLQPRTKLWPWGIPRQAAGLHPPGSVETAGGQGTPPEQPWPRVTELRAEPCMGSARAMSAEHRAGARSILRCTSLPRRLPIGAWCAAPPAVNSLCPAGLQRGGAGQACELGKEGDSAELTNSLIRTFARCVSAISSVMLLPAAASHAATSQGGLSRPRQGPGDRPQVGAQGKARNAARTPAWPGGGSRMLGRGPAQTGSTSRGRDHLLPDMSCRRAARLGGRAAALGSSARAFSRGQTRGCSLRVGWHRGARPQAALWRSSPGQCLTRVFIQSERAAV